MGFFDRQIYKASDDAIREIGCNLSMMLGAKRERKTGQISVIESFDKSEELMQSKMARC